MSLTKNTKADYGLLIDYEYCSGCDSCVVACKEEHNYPVGKWGIKVLEEGPWEIEDGTGVYNYNYIPVPTDLQSEQRKGVSHRAFITALPMS